MLRTYDEKPVKFWAFVTKVQNLRIKIQANTRRKERNV